MCHCNSILVIPWYLEGTSCLKSVRITTHESTTQAVYLKKSDISNTNSGQLCKKVLTDSLHAWLRYCKTTISTIILQFRHTDRSYVHDWIFELLFFKFPYIVQIYAWFFMYSRNWYSDSNAKYLEIISRPFIVDIRDAIVFRNHC